MCAFNGAYLGPLIPAIREWMFSIDERFVIAPDIILLALQNPDLLGIEVTAERLMEIPYVRSIVEIHQRLMGLGFSVTNHGFYLKAWETTFGEPEDLRPTPFVLSTVIEDDAVLRTRLTKLKSLKINLEALPVHALQCKVPATYPNYPTLDPNNPNNIGAPIPNPHANPGNPPANPGQNGNEAEVAENLAGNQADHTANPAGTANEAAAVDNPAGNQANIPTNQGNDGAATDGGNPAENPTDASANLGNLGIDSGEAVVGGVPPDNQQDVTMNQATAEGKPLEDGTEPNSNESGNGNELDAGRNVGNALTQKDGKQITTSNSGNVGISVDGGPILEQQHLSGEKVTGEAIQNPFLTITNEGTQVAGMQGEFSPNTREYC